MLARFAGCKPAEVEDEVFKRYRLRVLLATVPDPVDANLDWAFDGSLEALRGALGTAGYVVCDSSLPWYDEAGKLRRR